MSLRKFNNYDMGGMPPVFGNRSGKASKTHWICFLKDGASDSRQIKGADE